MTPAPTQPNVLWGEQTRLAVDNFRISGRGFPPRAIAWVAAIKSAAAIANAELGVVDAALAAEIRIAADAIRAGHHDDQFPVDVFQTGSGTSTNMNVNEVISALTDHRAHPNDDVNAGQSSNDVMPTAVQLAACEAITTALLPAMEVLVNALARKADEFADVVKPGRTHLMDAVPVLMGDEFAGYAAQIGHAAAAVGAQRAVLARVPLGGTAVGNGLGADPRFAARVAELLDDQAVIGAPIVVGEDRFALQGARDATVAASGALNVAAVALNKVANDLRWMASGPNTGLAEIALPALQKGSSIMPGKVNPVIPEVVVQVAAQVIGNHATITTAGMQGSFELNTMIPVIARNLLESIDLLAAACRALAENCVAGITADRDRCRAAAERSLPLATALNATLGYDAVERIVRGAASSGRTVREAAIEQGVDPALLDDVLDLDRIARGE